MSKSNISFWLTNFVLVAIIIKFGFVFFALMHAGVSHSKKYKDGNKKVKRIDKRIIIMKQITEFIFMFLMSLLLLFLFMPNTNNIKYITKETKILMFLYGILLIITANWRTLRQLSTFFHH